MSARRFVIHGRVQGVGFRYFVAREAEALGLAGWVRNRADGSVEVLADGDEPVLDTLAGRLWQGPPFAKVTAVEATAAEPHGTPGFRVLGTPF
jgi:acylphosphatase